MDSNRVQMETLISHWHYTLNYYKNRQLTRCKLLLSNVSKLNRKQRRFKITANQCTSRQVVNMTHEGIVDNHKTHRLISMQKRFAWFLCIFWMNDKVFGVFPSVSERTPLLRSTTCSIKEFTQCPHSMHLYDVLN